MELVVEDVEVSCGKETSKAKEAIEQIKKHQLLGVELNAEMYTLVATNMILRGDGSSRIEKGSAFNRPESLYDDFGATTLLLNPPFSFDENGLPFIAYGLDKMQKGGLGAIIIQDSAGSGKAVKTACEILSKHTLLASIKFIDNKISVLSNAMKQVYAIKMYRQIYLK